MDLFLTNGIVIDPARKVQGKMNCLIRNGVIAEWTKAKQAPNGVTTIDLQGLVLAPGFVDLHVHLRDPGQEYKEDIRSGAHGALAGGFTGILCMANTQPVNDTASVTRYIREQADAARGARVYVAGAVSKGLQGEALADIGDLAAAGVVALSDDGMCVGNSLLMRCAMEYAADFGLPVLTHCEDPHLCCGTVMHEGAASTRLGLRGRPDVSESIMVLRDLQLARLTGTRLHIQHVSTAAACAALQQAKADGVAVTCEVTPHHLLLTDDAVASYDPVFKMNPPLRTAADVAALRQALRNGLIDAIATDHAPHGIVDKDDLTFEDASCGVLGMECALSVCLKLVDEKIITLPRLMHLLSRGPASALGLPGGRLAVGDPADLVIFDPDAKRVIRAAEFVSKSRNCPFEGWTCRGHILMTLVGGEIRYDRLSRLG